MDSIDWDKIPEKFNWAMKNSSGQVFATNDKPVFHDDVGWTFRGDYFLIGHDSSLGWRESLQRRPIKEPAEPDWKAKYEQLRKHYEHLQADMQAQECAYNVVVRDKSLMEKQRDMARRERNAALTELGKVQRKAGWFDVIASLVNKKVEDELGCDDD